MINSETRATRVIRRDGRFDVKLMRVYRLRVSHPNGTQEAHQLARESVRVGSRPGNDIVLQDDAVSRLHFEIRAERDGYRLHDLGSTNGTFVDGYRTGEIYLRHGSQIAAGASKLVFEVLEAEAEMPLSSSEHFGPLVGRSTSMREMFATLERIAPTASTVLIEGETGTGKERIAEALHGASHRARGPFVVFDCGAVAANLLESELFGHEKGAFTGAESRRAGCMEEADGGTLFLDEIGELPLELQPKLLRALEQREVRRIGSTRTLRVDLRIVAATNRDLAQEVNRGAFRDDLYYRLAVVRVRVPPLRERPEDIPILSELFLRKALDSDPGRADAVWESMQPQTWERLKKHPWPGNVRELRNVVERALALSGPGLPVSLEPTNPLHAVGASRVASAERPEDDSPRVDLGRPFMQHREEVLARFEKEYLLGILEKNGGKFSRAAAAAGIDRAYFKRLLRKYQE